MAKQIIGEPLFLSGVPTGADGDALSTEAVENAIGSTPNDQFANSRLVAGAAVFVVGLGLALTARLAAGLAPGLREELAGTGAGEYSVLRRNGAKFGGNFRRQGVYCVQRRG